MKTQNSNFVCNPASLSEKEVDQFELTSISLLKAVQETHELDNGYAFLFPNQPNQLLNIARFIERESLCCPFLRFKLEFEPATGPVWLHITGEEGTKSFLREELDQIRNPENP